MDNEVFDLIDAETHRQKSTLNLIPSENYTSDAVREAVGSVLMHKYSEGNIDKRYYEGNENIDLLEELAIERARQLFRLPDKWAVNVQALSGSNANLAVYLALLEPGDTIMGMYLPDGGHLSHGWSYEPKVTPSQESNVYLGGSRKVNITSRMFKSISYKVNSETQLLDYAKLAKIAEEYKPKILISGGTAYPRLIDHQKMKDIAKSVGAYYMADIAHEAGLIAAGVLPSPVGIADVVTMTTHKTLRAARGAIILGPADVIEKVNKAIQPGLQGGPFNNNIAGIAVGLHEALQPEFKTYAEQILKNAKVLESEFLARKYKLVSGGTDKHLLLIDLSPLGIGGKFVAQALAKAGIVVNMNTMPGETKSPANPSAIRIGTPFVTTQGLKKTEMKQIVEWIDQVIKLVLPHRDLALADFQAQIDNDQALEQIKLQVAELMTHFYE